MDIIDQKVKNMSGSLTDLAPNISALGKKIHVFTFSTQKDFSEWAGGVFDSFDSFVTSAQSVKKAFNLTTNAFKKSLEVQADVAAQGAKDIKELMGGAFAKDSDFVQFLIDQGPAAVHAFVNGSKPEQAAMKKSWDDISEATGKYQKAIEDLPDVTTKFMADTQPARDEIKGFMEDLKAQGFTLTPGGLVVGGELRHGGGIAGAGGYTMKKLTPDEVPSILQKGEFVIQRSVAQQPGMLQFLEMVNAGMKFSEFHSGGVVDRSNLIQMMGLQNSMRQLSGTLSQPPDASMRVDAKLPSVSELIEKLIGTITGIGGAGVSPNASRYAAVIRAVFGDIPMGFISRRNIAGTNTWSQHAYGNAVDVMTGANSSLRQSVAMFSDVHRAVLSIAHLLADPWFRSPLGDHYNHVHADFNPQGTGTPPPGGGWIGARRGFHGRLTQDTNIRAHAGERVDISPRGSSNEPLKLKIVDWRNGLAELSGEMDWRDWKGSR